MLGKRSVKSVLKCLQKCLSERTVKHPDVISETRAEYAHGHPSSDQCILQMITNKT